MICPMLEEPDPELRFRDLLPYLAAALVGALFILSLIIGYGLP